MTRAVAAAIAALAIALVGAETAQACSCVYVPPEKQFRAADGAIVARLLAVRPVGPEPEGDVQPAGEPADFVYRVGRIYKRGPGLRRGRRLTLRSMTDGCRLPDTERELYGLFLERRGRRWVGSLCTVVTRAQMRRAAASRSRAHVARVSSMTGMRRCAARSRYWTQPG